MPLISRLQSAVAREPPGIMKTTMWLGVAVAVPTGVRIALNPLLGSTLWFPTYYPAALIGTLFLGWQSGLLLIFLSAVAANYFFVPPQFELSLGTKDIVGTLTFALADSLIVLAAALLRSTLTRLEAARDLEGRLNAELQHRMKNTLTILQAIIHQTATRYSDPKDFELALNGHIAMLSSAHDLLSHGRWEICELPELAQRAVAPFENLGRVEIGGPECALTAECCVPLVLALHELATNSLKYGALSKQDGTAQLTWDVTGDKVLLRWVERNGPVVTGPKRRGLGSRLLSTQSGLENVTLEFKPGGVECYITVCRAKAEGTGKIIIKSAPSNNARAVLTQ